MSNKFSTIALGTMLGLSTVAFSGASASAAAMLPLSPAATGQANAASDGIVQVDSTKIRQMEQEQEMEQATMASAATITMTTAATAIAAVL